MPACTDCRGLGYRLRELEQGGGGTNPEETIEKLQTEPDWQDIKILPIGPWTVMRLEITLLASDVNNTSRATFKRTGLFYREAGNALHQGSFWHTTDTTKSHGTMDTRYVLNGDSVTIQTKNAGSVATQWIGMVRKWII
jgi:hypothetical protein